MGGHQSWSGHGSEEKNSQPLPGLELPIIQIVAQRYTTELFRHFDKFTLVGFKAAKIEVEVFWVVMP
jgi:hypothetical protein